MNCNNKNINNKSCGCNCHPQPPQPTPDCPVDINMSVCDRNMNVLPMLQTYTTKVLKPNLHCKKNILTQDMISCAGYKYVIKWDFDLNGQTITVPENCILEFDGGTLRNGTIIGQDTVYNNVGDLDNIFGDGIIKEGTWIDHFAGGGGGDHVQSDWAQTCPLAPDYIKNKPTIPPYVEPIQSDWAQNDQYALDYIKNKPVIPAEQIPSDWNQTDPYAKDFIKNKPDITPMVQVQADWEQDNTQAVDYIKNKPEIPAAQVQSDWEQDNTSSVDYIQNKPVLGTAAEKNVAASGNAGSGEVVMGNDTRLSDSRPASDVYSWAKQSSKPEYTAQEVGAIPVTEKGANDGVATLGSDGKVPSSQLPAGIDSIVEGYYNTGDGKFYEHKNGATYTDEITPVSNKVYLDLDTNKQYRWSGSQYVEISSSLALGETSSTAYRGDRGKIAYDHSQSAHAPANANAADIGYASNYITKNIDGVSSNVVAASTIVGDGGAVTNVAYNGTSKKITKTVNGTTSDVVTAATLKTDMELNNVGNFKAVSTVANQGLTTTEKSNARTNIGAGTSNFSGNYNDLTNKPTIPAAQIQSDWNQSNTSSADYIKNKPTIPAAQVQSDWNQSNPGAVDYILNKPIIDTALSETSENAVQNKVITQALACITQNTDKEYDPEDFSGYGRVYLKKNIVNIGGVEVNLLTQDAFYKDGPNGTRVPNTNTVFVVEDDFQINDTPISHPSVSINSSTYSLIGSRRGVHLFEYNYTLFNKAAASSITIADNNYIDISGYRYYYTTINISTGKTLRLLDTENLIILKEVDGAYTYDELTYHVTNNSGSSIPVCIASDTPGTYASAYDWGDIYYYESVDLKEGQTIKLLDTTNLRLLTSLSTLPSPAITEYTALADTTVYIAGRTTGVYGQDINGVYQKGYKYYYTSVSLPANNKLQLIDSSDCVLLNSSHNDWLYDDSVPASGSASTVYIASRTYGSKGQQIVEIIGSGGNDTITIPDNCVLEFNGGSISHGTIVGSDTVLIADKVAIFDKITIDGTWKVKEITSDWFKDAEMRDRAITNCFTLASDDIYNEITIEEGDYWVRSVIRGVEPETDSHAGAYIGGSDCSIKSNTKLILKGNIRMRPHYCYNTKVIGSYNTHDVVITGGGCVYGDRDEHVWKDQYTHEQGYGLGMRVRNLTIDGINVRNTQGDGINISHQPDGPGSATENVVIRNFSIDRAYRNGITLGGCNVLVENGYITNTKGTAPEDGIDIEISSVENPKHSDVRQIIRNVRIDNANRGIQVRTAVSGGERIAEAVGEIIVENVEMNNVRQGFNKHLQANKPLTIRDSYINLVPGYVCGKSSGSYSNWGVRQYALPDDYFNRSSSAVTVSNCVIEVTGDYPEGVNYFNVLLADLRHTTSDRHKVVENCKISCPGIIAFSSSYGNFYTNNSVEARRFGDSLGISDSDDKSLAATINNCDIMLNGVKYKGMNYPSSFYFDGAVVNGCELRLTCPIRVYNSVVENCKIVLDLENYHYYFTETEKTQGYPYDSTALYEGSPTYLISASLSRFKIINNLITSISMPSSGLDYLVYGRNTEGTTAREMVHITDNIFASTVAGSGISARNNINKDSAGVVFKGNIQKQKILDDFISPYRYTHSSTNRSIYPFTFMFKHTSSDSHMVPVTSSQSYGVQYPIFMYIGSETLGQNTPMPLGTLVADGVVKLSDFIPAATSLNPGSPVYLIIGRNNDSPNTALPSSSVPEYSQTILDDPNGELLFIEVGVAISDKHVRMHLGYPPIYCTETGVVTDYRDINPDWFKNAY